MQRYSNSFFHLLLTLTAITFSFPTIQASEDFIEAPGTKARFPKTLNVEMAGKSINFQATGAATRKKMLVNVYGMAHYISQPIEGTRRRSSKLSYQTVNQNKSSFNG